MKTSEIDHDHDRLPDDLRDILLFEMSFRFRPGRTKAAEVHDRFGISAHSYRRLLRLAIQYPESERLAPSVVARARRT